MSVDEKGLLADPHEVGIVGTLVTSGHRVGVQVGAHEVLYLDALLRGLVGKEVEVRVKERKP